LGLLLALGGGALFLHRRKVTMPGQLQIQERISLGPKRMLALAQWGDEMMLLGVSEAGITLLKSQPAEKPILLDEGLPTSASASASPLATSFEELLGDLPEDAALRAKLRAGRSGRVE
jgi:flagellar biogenesis protein FliO